MHNVKHEPNTPLDWPEATILNDVAYNARQIARYADIAGAMLNRGHRSDYAQFEQLLTEKLADLNKIFEAHFRAPTTASVQHVARETQGVAA